MSTPNSIPNNSTRYLPGLDGLRALAVIAVLLYHADLGWFPGGFLGVEVFFVINGYLITFLLLGEIRETGRLDLKRFWWRRARRLLPAVFLLLLATLAFAVVFLPGEVASLRSDALASFGYITNWYLIFEQQSYFQVIGRPSLLRHLWSLAVEEQFYLLWPPLLYLLIAWLKPKRALLVVLAGILASTLLMAGLYSPEADPSRVYYGTDTRASGLLIGAALAFFWTPDHLSQTFGWLKNILLAVAGLAAIAGLAYFCLNLGEFDSFLYQGGFALVALLSALAIAAVVHPSSRLLPWLIGCPPLKWIGQRSYSLYLWHWPVYALSRPHLDVTLDGVPLLLARTLVFGSLAELSYRYVEKPVRDGSWKAIWQENNRFPRGRWVPTALVGAAFAATMVLMLGMAVAQAVPSAAPSYLSASSIHLGYYNNIPATARPTLTPSLSTPPATATPAPVVPATTIAIAPDPTATPEPLPTPTPEVTIPPVAPARPVLAIGDSVMIGAAHDMRRLIGDLEVDAAVSRWMYNGLQILQEKKEAGQLGDVVIIHLATNGPITAKQMDELMSIVAGVKTVVLVNTKVPRNWEASNNKVLAEAAQRYPNAVLVDWYGASHNHPNLFWDDGIHLRPEGANLFATLVAAAIPNVPGRNAG